MANLTAVKMKPGTTPILTVVLDDEDISEATIYVTIDMGDKHLVKTNYHDEESLQAEPIYEDGSVVGTQITVQYSQADTLALRPGNASVEVGWVFEDLTADKSNIGRLDISKTLYKEVMAYGRHSS